MKDELQRSGNCLYWSRVDPALPGGLHEPKLPGDIGWDLEAMTDVTIGPMESADVPVNARLQLPKGFYADIRNRSSMARRGLYVDQNLIDTGYRGPLFVFIRNMALPPVTIKAGERIAQLVFHKAWPVWQREVDEIKLDTPRSEDGFGSTGR